MGSLKDKKTDKIERREFLRSIGRTTLFVLTGGFFLERTILNLGKGQVWQIDPSKCVQCGNCATSCVLNISAVKCVHRFDRCGYCKLCFGYFQPGAKELNEATENQVCPTNA
ncbi:4Fe-4S binding protein, partial [bacterium]|nr:4Fe-4S binding protein [bacterium]